MINADLINLIDQKIEFESNGVKKQSNVLAAKPGKRGKYLLYVETVEADGSSHRAWVDLRFFQSWVGQVAA